MNRQLPKRSTQPMGEGSYRACAERLRRFADDLADCAGKPDPRTAALKVVTGAMRYLHHLTERLKR